MLPNEKRFDPHRQGSLISPKRSAYWNPAQFLERFGLRPGEIALDVGSGPGFWTLPLAEMVGPAGQVWALDASQDLLDTLAAREPPSHVRLLRTELPMIERPNRAADFAWVAFVFHEVEPPESFAAELRRVLKTNGRLAVLDWRPDAKSEQGPAKAHRVGPAQVVALLLDAGFTRVDRTWQDDDNYLVEATNT